LAYCEGVIVKGQVKRIVGACIDESQTVLLALNQVVHDGEGTCIFLIISVGAVDQYGIGRRWTGSIVQVFLGLFADYPRLHLVSDAIYMT
jgi:hypothetical protein